MLIHAVSSPMKTLFFNRETREISFQTGDGIFYIPKPSSNSYSESFPFECILGVINVTNNSKYLFFCLESDVLGWFDRNTFSKEIFSIRKVGYVPITVDESEESAVSIKDLIESLNFYYTFDKVEDHFLWNIEMIRNFNELPHCTQESTIKNNRNPFSMKYKTSNVQKYVIPSMFCGYFEVQNTKNAGVLYTLKIMSMISTKKIGPRMLSRGIDAMGNVSFFVETQFLIEDNTTSTIFRILRGSIPLYWSQTDPLRPHKINIDENEEANNKAFKKHMEKLEKRYGKIVVVNLLGGRKYEKILCKMYGDQCKKESINYIHFDLNKHAENIKNIKNAFYRQLSKCMDEIQQGKTVFLDEPSKTVVDSSSQKSDFEELSNEWEDEIQTATDELDGVFDLNGITFRVNCVDCLDRTNIGQHLIFNFFDKYKLGISKSMWVNNGNALSKMYTGSDTLKNELSYNGKLSVFGKMNDLMISANRMINNKFTDKDKQLTIDTILGKSTFEQ